MRPVRLGISGFAAFREPVVVDFTDADYFALVGPTGAGKSSVLDAMCLALYGSVPRYDKSEIGPVVSLGSVEARVALEFTVGDERFVVVRVLRRSKTDVKTKEVRLERVLVDGTTEVLAGAQRDAAREIPRVVGLGYDHFCKCVLLPQGQFAQFLHDPPSDRQALLRELLDLGVYRRIHQAAGAREKDAADRGRFLQEQVDKLPESSPELIADAGAHVAAIAALDTDLAAAHDEFAARATAGRAARAATERATQVLGALDEVAMPIDALDAVAALGAAQQQLQLCEQALTAADAASERADGAVASAPDLALLRRAADAHDELGVARDALAALDGELTPITEAGQDAADALSNATEGYERAVEATRAVELDHAPHELAAKLEVGAPCPVCEQVVRKLPKTVRDQSALAAARKAEAKAKKARDAAERAAQQAMAALHRLEATRAARAERVQQCESAVQAHSDRDALIATIAEVEALVATRDSARAEQKALEQRRRDAQRARDDAQQRARAHEQAFGAQRDALVSAGLAVPPAAGDLAADWPALVALAVEARPEHEKARDAAAEELARLLAEDRAALGALATRAEPLGVAPATTLAELVKAVAVAHTSATHALDQLRAVAERRAELDAEIAVLRDRAAVAGTVHRMLRVDRFEAWLLEEAMDALLDGGSETLRRLSSGAYSLARERNELMVVDHHNADETRSVRTLSGGETFQASLALALALADHIAALDVGGAAKLESLFLDEGFGSLDPETLDVVAATVETLADGERMVGMVTHVRELAERVPVRFEVRKAGSTSVVERVER
jgi:exonuclease SbcC